MLHPFSGTQSSFKSSVESRGLASVCFAYPPRSSDTSGRSSRRGRDADETAPSTSRRHTADSDPRQRRYQEQSQLSQDRRPHRSSFKQGSSGGGISDGFEVVSTSQRSRSVVNPSATNDGTSSDDDDPLDGSTVWRDLSAWGLEDEADEGEEEGNEDELGDEGADLEDDKLDADDSQAVDRLEDLALAAAMEAETPEQRDLRQRYTGKQPLNRFMGPLKTTTLKGKGRGVVTTAVVAPGDLLMIAVPFLGPVLFCSRQGETPENEALAQHLLRHARLGPKQQAILNLLTSDAAEVPAASAQPAPAAAQGDAAQASPGAKQRLARLPSLDEFQAAGEEGIHRDDVARGTSASSAPESSATVSPIQMSLERLESIVNVNCLGEEFQDLAATALSGVGPSRGHLGLWPEPALLNHACAPTATSYTIGDRLLVVATEEHREGSEVTISYLGAALTTPLNERRTLLQEQYGFACACVRCRAEQQVTGKPLEQVMTTTYQRCQEVSPMLEACIERGDLVGVKRCQTELLGLRAAFEAALRQEKVSSRLSAKACRWLQASVYDLYDLLSLAADELAGTELAPRSTSAATATGVSALVDTESLAVCARLVEGVAPGSDSHCALAAELAERTVTRFGEEHEEARQARVMCDNAFRTRYGSNLSVALLRQLIAARLTAEDEQ